MNEYKYGEYETGLTKRGEYVESIEFFLKKQEEL